MSSQVIRYSVLSGTAKEMNDDVDVSWPDLDFGQLELTVSGSSILN